MIQAIVLAAGKGDRLKSKIEKPYIPVGGIPILVWTLRVLESVREIDSIVLVVSRQWHRRVKQEILIPYHLHRVRQIVVGGKTRMESVYAGLCSLNDETKIVLVHDAARPFVRREAISQLIKAVKQTRAVCPGVVPKDTIKKIDKKSWIEKTLIREELRAILTPQVFERKILVKAYERAFKRGYTATDDAGLVERLGVKVKVIASDPDNIKITTPDDLLFAEATLSKRENQNSDIKNQNDNLKFKVF